MSEHLHQLAGAYALDALPDEEQEEFERHLRGCESCQEEVAGYRETAALLGAAAAEQAPAGMRARVLDAIDQTPQDSATADRTPPQPATTGRAGVVTARPPAHPRAAGDGTPAAPASLDAARDRRRRRGRFDLQHSGIAAAAAAVAVVVVVGAGAVVGQRLGDEAQPGDTPTWLDEAQTASLSGTEGVTARFAYHPERDEGMLLVEGLEPLDPDRSVYQLWLFHDEEPVPAGVFTTDEDGTARVPADAQVVGAELVAVTVEPPGGRPTPSGEPILAGQL